MKKFLLAVAALLCVGSVAMAGVNANGTIFLHYNSAAIGTDGNFSGYGGLQSCDAAVTEAPASTAPGAIPGAWFAYAAFPTGSSPRVSVITAGLQYDGNQIFILTFGNTSSGQLPTTTPPWPSPGSGIAVQWDNAQTAQLFEWYWFTGYGYMGAQLLSGHPSQGGGFTDDAIPSTTDPIADYGSLGFGELGHLACPGAPPPHQGACCFADGSCLVLTADACAGQGGAYYGDDTVCDPNPCIQPHMGACCNDTICAILTQDACLAGGGLYQGDDTTCDPNPCITPVQHKTWGEIKHNYR